jgi:pre-mRNA-splicing helicase BRR2
LAQLYDFFAFSIVFPDPINSFKSNPPMNPEQQEDERGTGYSYAANSNLVLQAKRTDLPRRDREPDGTAESLWGRLDGHGGMGDRAVAAKEKKPVKKQQESKKVISSSTTAAFEGLVYSPQTQETKQSYEMILSLVQVLLGDTPEDLLRASVDEILIILNDVTLTRDLDKKTRIEVDLAIAIDAEKFSALVNLSKRLTDYSAATAVETGGENSRNAQDEMDGKTYISD